MSESERHNIWLPLEHNKATNIIYQKIVPKKKHLDNLPENSTLMNKQKFGGT